MEDLLRSYWWLMFPLAGMIIGRFRGGLDYQRRLDLPLGAIKSHVARGRDKLPSVLGDQP